MKKQTRCAALAIAAIMATVGMTGCGKTKTSKKEGDSGDVTLTYWMALSSMAASTVSDYGETPFAKKLQEDTGVKIKFQHPSQGQEKEKFNILMAMNDLPDIISYGWADYPGGPGKAIAENKIIDLTDDIKTKAPDFYKIVKDNPDWAKLMKTDDGKIYNFPFIRGDKSLLTSQGFVLRRDWLDELGLDVPTTISEWETVLGAFKDKKGATPISLPTWNFNLGAFCGAWGVCQGYYLDNGQVKYGQLEPGFKEFIVKMNEWYKNGLLDKDIASFDSKAVDTKLLNDKLGATVGSVGSGIGRWMSMKKSDSFDLVPAPMPVLNKGDQIKFSFQNFPVVKTGAAITTSCKNIDAAYKLLNYGYSEKGNMLFNFGIEGESYNLEDGYPKYTDTIVKNSDGLSMAASLSRYAQSCDVGSFIQDKRYMEQYGSLPEQQEALKLWSEADVSDQMLPYIYYNESESADIIKKNSAVESYSGEMVLKFIMGIEPISKYDEFVNELKNRGVMDVIAAQQAGYERYLKR